MVFGEPGVNVAYKPDSSIDLPLRGPGLLGGPAAAVERQLAVAHFGPRAWAKLWSVFVFGTRVRWILKGN